MQSQPDKRQWNERKKLDSLIAREKVDAKAIRVYFGKIRKEIASSIEREENPHVYIDKTFNEKRGVHEIRIMLMGERHMEDLSYFTSDPEKWKSFGAITLSLIAAERFIDALKNVVHAPVKETLMTIEAGEVLVTFWKPRAWSH